MKLNSIARSVRLALYGVATPLCAFGQDPAPPSATNASGLDEIVVVAKRFRPADRPARQVCGWTLSIRRSPFR